MKTIIMLGANYLDRYDFDAIFSSNSNFEIIILSGPLSIEKNRMIVDKYQLKYYNPALDYFRDPNVEILNEDSVIYLVGEILRNKINNDVFIYCDDEKYMLLAGSVRDFYKLNNGLSYNETLLFRDKLVMKNKIKENGKNIPNYASIEEFLINDDLMVCYYNIIKYLNNKYFIVKPRALAGSFGFVKIFDFKDFVDFITFSYDSKLKFMVEEFINGDLYHVDIILHERKIRHIFVCEYSAPNADTLSGKIFSSLPLKSNSPIYMLLRDYAGSLIDSFNTINGALHLELFIDKNTLQPIFLEIGCRPAGAHIAKLYHLNYNINIFNEHLITCCELYNKHIDYEYNKISYCCGYISTREGIYNGIKIPEINSKLNVIEVFSIGDEMKKSYVIGNYVATFEIYNCKYNELYNDFKTLSTTDLLV